jgi:hypothetical protein
VIHNVVVHLNNEQPLVADLFEMPTITDAVLRCTNLRTLDGKRPVFVDHMHSIFFFPYLIIRFVEILPTSLGVDDQSHLPVPVGVVTDGLRESSSDGPDDDLEIDEDFLRRIREV